jgi:hypothetical protein
MADLLLRDGWRDAVGRHKLASDDGAWMRSGRAHILGMDGSGWSGVPSRDNSAARRVRRKRKSLTSARPQMPPPAGAGNAKVVGG